ncbi:DUF6455 family protein [Aliiroseovarius sp. YM-037]|uniref:DUF6455 family protein n=1 Tax=Aliiroseovarius sp. YM-037 TaxID=3341728 RepID=UPI003A801F85
MNMFTKFSRHAELVGRMSDVLGVDLGDKAMRGEMPPEELRSTVMRCMGCDNPGGCHDWLETHADGSAQTPGYCRNKAVLERLRVPE